MADRYWVGGKSGSETSWDDADNWATTSGGSGGAGVPTTSDDVFIDGGAATDYDCIAAGAANCKSLTASSGFTDDISIGGLLTVDDGNASFDHTGTLTLNDVTVNGNSKTLHIGSGVGTVTATSCDVTWNGTGGTWDNDKGFSVFGKLSLAASAGLTLDGSATIFRSTSTPLTLGDNSTLTINAQCWLNCNGSVDLWSLGTGYTINGSSNLVISNGGVTGLTVTMPAITVGGNVSLNFYDLPANTFTMTGDFTVATAMYITNSAGIATFDCDGYDINVTPGFQGLAIGSGGAGPTNKMLIYFGSGTHTLTRLEVQYNGTGTYTYLESATFNIGGNVTFGSNHNIDTGTSVINLTGTSNCTFTSNGKSVYDLNINKTGGTGVTFTGNIDSHDFEVETTNTQAVTWSGYTLTSDGNVSLNGTGTLDLGNGVTCNGASSNFHIDSTVGTVTATSCVLTMNTATAGVIDIDKGTVIFARLIFNDNAIVSRTGNTPIIQNTDQLVVIGDNVTITDMSSDLRITASTNTPYVIGTGVVFENFGSGTVITIRGTTAGITIGLPALNMKLWYSVYPSIQIYDWASNTTCNMLGDFTASNLYIQMYNTGFTFNTNNHTINATLGGLTYGSWSTAPSTGVFNFGSSTINCGFVTSDGVNGTATTVNFDSATFNCTGLFKMGSNHTVNPGTSTLNVLNTSSITLAGKSLHTVNLNAPTKTITSVDNLTTTGALTITDGTTYATGATTTTVGTNLTDLNGTTFNKLVMASTSAKQITIGAGKTMTLSTAANSDISGSSGAACTIRSNSSGTQATIAFPSQLTLSYVDVKDIISSGFQTLANNGTNVTGGNNTNWKFMNLDSVSPNIIKLAGGDIITVTDNGTGIRGTCTVSVEGDAGTSVTVVDSQHLTFAAPAKGVIGTYDVTVSTDDGESFTLTNELEYDEAPIITSVSPVKGPTAGGITVDVNGSGFEAVQGTGIVKFDGVEVTAYNSWADNKVNVTIPAHATGFVDVYLKDTPGGEDTLTNGFQYKDSGGAGTFFFFE